MLRLCMTFALIWASLGSGIAADPYIAGMSSAKLSQEAQGRVLLDELNCVACHGAGNSLTRDAKKSPRLARVSARLNPYHLEAFIQNPHGLKAGTTMPEVMHQMPEGERRKAAEAITHFLMSLHDQDSFMPTAPDHVAAEYGRDVFHQRGCVACHSPRNDQGEETMTDESVPLGDLSKKYSFKSLVHFLRRPHEVRPSGRMPDMRLPGRETEQVAHYLLQNTRTPGHLKFTTWRGQVWEGLHSPEVTKERGGMVRNVELSSLGQVHHNSAIRYEGFIRADSPGEFRFMVEMNGGVLRVNGRDVINQTPSNRRGVKKLEGKANILKEWSPFSFDYFHTGRDPKLTFEIEGPGFPRAGLPANMLSVSNQEIAPYTPWQVDQKQVEEGKRYFSALGCVQCHDDVRAERQTYASLAELNSNKGCLSQQVGIWPRFSLSEAQRRALQAALPDADQMLEPEAQLNKGLVSFNCIACHERRGLGGISDSRETYFSGSKPELGNQGRIPPPLTDVGAKLTSEWMREVMIHGKRQRKYVNVSMPQFGEGNVGHLMDLFATLDDLEVAKIPEADGLKAAGHQLIGTDGLSCIACHDFNGQKAGGAGALELIDTTKRLQQNWFHLYMRDPSRFHPLVIMPSYWPGGVAARKEILEGDPGLQIEALWQYLSDGRKARNPVGLSRQSDEIRVTDVAEMCRGRGPAGYRGIAVGYPNGLSLAFDSEQMNLRSIWKGEFASARPNSWSPRGGDRITFPAGIPFHNLEDWDAEWPYKGKTDYLFPHDHGYQYRGYFLDGKKRPIFTYEYQGIMVEDYFEDVMDDKGASYFKRTLTLDAAVATAPFHFRLGAGKKVERIGNNIYRVDGMNLTLSGVTGAKIRDGDPQELLVPLAVPEGKMELVVEYRW